MTETAAEVRRSRVLRVYHSSVVTAWRRRDRELGRHGWAVTTVSPRRWNEGGAMVDLVVDADEDVVVAVTVGRHPFLFVYNPLPIWRALRRGSFDVLDVHEEPAALAAVEVLALARLAGVTAPVTLYSAQNIAKRYPPPFRWFERWALRRAAAVHTCNDEVESVLRGKGFTGPVVNLGLGVDLEQFSPGDEPTGAPGALRVGFAGRLQEFKGIFTLLHAVLATDGASLEYVGGGPDLARLESVVRARGVGDRVSVRGFVDFDALPEWYRSIDVLVVPTHDMPNVREQFGRISVEAMASGVPVVVSDCGALPDVVGDAGIVCPQADVGALASTLEQLRDDPGLRDDLAERGIRRAADFSWDAIAGRQADLYRGVVTGAG